MIRVTHLRDAARTGEETVVEVTLGQAVNDLLSLYSQFDNPSIGTSADMVTASDGVLCLGLTSYKPVGHYSDAYGKLYCAARLLRVLTYAHEDEERGETSNVDFNVVQMAAAHNAKDRLTIAPTEQSYTDYKAILGFIIQWLLGRQLELSLGTSDEVVATLLALEQELDTGTKFEVTLGELLSA